MVGRRPIGNDTMATFKEAEQTTVLSLKTLIRRLRSIESTIDGIFCSLERMSLALDQIENNIGLP